MVLPQTGRNVGPTVREELQRRLLRPRFSREDSLLLFDAGMSRGLRRL
jgi:hypothetical protein